MTSTEPTDRAFRALPSVDRLLQMPALAEAAAAYSHAAAAEAARAVLAGARRRVASGEAAPPLEALAEQAAEALARAYAPTLVPVINATGVVIHTNLGRAPLSAAARAAMLAVAEGYSTLEFDLASGTRGSRHAHAASLLCRLTGAEAALIVNNCASAVLLALTALAAGREVVVSRGQAVEIGGGFRIPDVLRQSGATLVEVGTTNRTYAADFAAAVTERTALFLRVHASNFKLIGFTHQPALAELVETGARHGVPVLDDLGSGALLDTAAYGIAHEPTVPESVAAGTAVVACSGDKLLGGPQCGILVGRRDAIEALRRHPLARAVRVDKLTLAALVATLLHYLRGEAAREIPIWRMLAATRAELERRAVAWRAALGLGEPAARVVPDLSTVGGGSLPGETLPTCLLALDGVALGCEAGELAARLRGATAPTGERVAGAARVVARVDRGRLLLDPRTVLPEQDAALVSALRAALERRGT